MIVVSYADFSADMNKYLSEASTYGLKILPQKKERRKSSKHEKFVQAIDAASGIIPSDIDVDKAKTEAILKR